MIPFNNGFLSEFRFYIVSMQMRLNVLNYQDVFPCFAIWGAHSCPLSNTKCLSIADVKHLGSAAAYFVPGNIHPWSLATTKHRCNSIGPWWIGPIHDLFLYNNYIWFILRKKKQNIWFLHVMLLKSSYHYYTTDFVKQWLFINRDSHASQPPPLICGRVAGRAPTSVKD